MIRAATHADIDALIALGHAMHAESRYAHMPWDRAKVHDLISGLIDSDDGLALVAESSDGIVGGFLGMVHEHYFTTVRVASDFAMFVRPDRRGSVMAASMLKAYVAWARELGIEMIQVGITTGVSVEACSRLYEACGFRPVGNLFEFGDSHG